MADELLPKKYYRHKGVKITFWIHESAKDVLVDCAERAGYSVSKLMRQMLETYLLVLQNPESFQAQKIFQKIRDDIHHRQLERIAEYLKNSLPSLPSIPLPPLTNKKGSPDSEPQVISDNPETRLLDDLKRKFNIQIDP